MKMFGTNGIRGVVNEYMSSELALKVGKSIAKVMGPGRIAVAKDTRTSADMVAFAVESGLLSMGVDVIDLGMVPTPALQYYVKTHSDVVAGVMITASHNPPEFNGIKCVSSDGTECSHEEEAAIEDAYEKELECPGWDGIGSVVHVADAGEAYIDAVVGKVDAEAIRNAGIKACLDCSNGAASFTTPLLMKKLGVTVTTINASADGRFPGHYSEPTEDNLENLKRITAETGSDLGFAHDGDADRCVFVTGSGRYVPGDQSLAILGRSAVKRDGSRTVVTTVATSSVVEEAVRSVGGEVVYTAVGSPVVARRMIHDGAAFGGEENGGLIFADHQYCRDGAMAIARMLEAVVKNGPLDEQVDSLPRFFTIKGAVACPDGLKDPVIKTIADRHRNEKVCLVDGLRIDYEDGWVLMRPSGTEPKFRVYSESKDKAVAEDRSRRFLEEVGAVMADLSRGRPFGCFLMRSVRGDTHLRAGPGDVLEGPRQRGRPDAPSERDSRRRLRPRPGDLPQGQGDVGMRSVSCRDQIRPHTGRAVGEREEHRSHPLRRVLDRVPGRRRRMVSGQALQADVIRTRRVQHGGLRL